MSEDVPQYGEMNEQRAREILGEAIKSDGTIDGRGDLILWTNAGELRTRVGLDGSFTADELEAIAWWMRNKC